MTLFCVNIHNHNLPVNYVGNYCKILKQLKTTVYCLLKPYLHALTSKGRRLYEY